MAKENKNTNRLIHEKSLYLLQHAHNPVDWYPWGQEAFTAAVESDKPIFLSIGYASCHWCHVMEEELFQDEETAALLNEIFICIKVDREELPEVDALYMEFAQTMIAGSTGWPLNLVLTPELKPFFAGTYMPKNGSRGMVGFLDVARKIQELWTGDEREKLLQQSDKIVEILRDHVKMKGESIPDIHRLQEAALILFKVADPLWGGMKGAPKFPLGYQAEFLLQFYRTTKEARALYLAEKTLEMMHRGGIYDHIGGGFHRYSVDERWEIPHFEKMLYDNAIIASAYVEAWRTTKNPLYRKIAEETLSYLLTRREGKGAFYAAEDADSAGVEGLFYTWTFDEIEQVLGPDLAGLIADYYNVPRAGEGNFEERSVLYMTESFEDFVERKGLPKEECKKQLRQAREELLQARLKRILPLSDDAIISSWNGLAIHAFAKAAFFLENNNYLQTAVEAATSIRRELFKDGQLYRRYREGESRFRAGLDDYAFLIRGLLSLFEAGAGVEWLEFAIELTDILERDFKSDEGSFYQTDREDMTLLIRKCHFADGAEPSGNAIHAENLLRLYQITWDKRYLKQAEDILKAVKRFVDAYPLGYCYHLIALGRYFDEKKATIIICSSDLHFRKQVVEILNNRHFAHSIVLFYPKESGLEKYLSNTPEEENQMSLCYEGRCKPIVSGQEAIVKALQQL